MYFYEKATEVYKNYDGGSDTYSGSSYYCCCSLFFSGAKSYFCQQYFRSGYCSFQLYTFTSVITMILNVILLIIGFFTCGKEFGVKTVYTSILLPVFLGVFEKIFPDFVSMTNSQELDILCYILVVSVGSSILFNRKYFQRINHH